MTVKTYLVGVFLDQLNEEGYPETFILNKPEHIYNTDTLQLKFAFIQTRNTPKPLVAKKALSFAVEPHLRGIRTNIPLLKVEKVKTE